MRVAIRRLPSPTCGLRKLRPEVPLGPPARLVKSFGPACPAECCRGPLAASECCRGRLDPHSAAALERGPALGLPALAANPLFMELAFLALRCAHMVCVKSAGLGSGEVPRSKVFGATELQERLLAQGGTPAAQPTPRSANSQQQQQRQPPPSQQRQQQQQQQAAQQTPRSEMSRQSSQQADPLETPGDRSSSSMPSTGSRRNLHAESAV
ncbi:hypothetical protein CYMTET_7209 [Cymbomonas tetramitiformis]|uniref:Uncharacterized protein n=1 Tax=Cymbomonas tetramitiformis TaxID=36881 RepID=A0AAE0GVP8_9CHLO|nr:hypothetical protein CYMTET_7209 [Cymbomonas tetramitiformis]